MRGKLRAKRFFRGFLRSFGNAQEPELRYAVFLMLPVRLPAHYNLMKSENGLKSLAEAGLSPELLRLSVGMEDPDQITEALKDALAAT